MARGAAKSEQTRRRILDAARTIARDRGYRGTTLARIQREAGVHAGSVYWHFADKDDLFAALVEHAYAETRANPTDATAPNPVQSALRSIVDNPSRYGLWRFNLQLMLDPDPAPPRTADVIRRMREDTQNQIVANWLDQLPPGVVERHPDLARRLAEHSLVTVEGCILSRVADRPVDEDAVTAAATHMMDQMVIDACAEAGVGVPDFVARRHHR